MKFEGDDGVTGVFLVNGEEVISAEEGTTVQLKLTIASGYTLDGEPTAVGATLTKLAGIYTFTVQKDDVIVTAKTRKYEEHIINVQADPGVHVSMKVKDSEVEKAVFGDSVMVTLSFDNKYTFKDISLDGAELNTLEDGVTYSFTMPDAEVNLVVHAQYNPENYKVSSLNVIDNDHIRNIETSIAQGAQILEGKQVLFRFDGDNIDNLEYVVEIYKAGSRLPEDKIEYSIKVQQKNGNNTTTYAVTFIMPEGDIDITLFSQATASEEGVNVILPEQDHVLFYGVVSGESYAVDEATLYLVPEDGYLIKSISYKADNGEEQSLTIDNGKVVLPLYEAKANFEVLMDCEYTGVADIVVAEGSEFTIEGKTTDVTVGSTVNLTLRANSGFSIQSVTVKTSEGEDVEFAFDASTDALTFTMPEEDVVISAETLSYFDLFYEKNDGISNVKFTLSGLDQNQEITGNVIGTDILVWFTVDSQNYRLDSVMIGNTVLQPEESIYQGGEGHEKAYRYRISEADDLDGDGTLTVIFNLTAKHGVTLAESKDYEILNAPAERPAEGEDVSFRLKPVVGKKIKSVKSDEVEIVASDTIGWYNFTMPESDVTIDVTTVDANTSTLSISADVAESWSLTDEYGESVQAGEFNVGDELTFSYTEKHGFVDYKVTAEGADLTKNEDGTYSLAIGEEDVSLSVTADEEASHSINMSEDLKSVANMSYTDDGISGSKAYVGHSIAVTLNITAENTTFNADAKAEIEGVDDAETTIAEDGLSATITFTMPDADVSINLAFTTVTLQENTIEVQWDLDGMSSDYYRQKFIDNFCVQSEQFGNPDEITIPWNTVYEATKPVYFNVLNVPSSYDIKGYPVVTVINKATKEYIVATDGTIFDHYKIENSWSIPHFLMPDAPVLIIVGFSAN